MLRLLKLGGSLLTDKTQEKVLRHDVLNRVAQEIAMAAPEPGTLILGHGSGSFGHFAGARYGTMAGASTAAQWYGFAEVATAAAELNMHVTLALRAAGLPVMHFQPSASAQAVDGTINALALSPIKQALTHGMLPLIYGDVAFDAQRGSTILSTEALFDYLARHLPVTEVILTGEVAGVLEDNGTVIPSITPTNFADITGMLGGSRGTDVTGGMASKVQGMLNLVQHTQINGIRIISGLEAGIIRDALQGLPVTGTFIQRA